MNHSGQVVGMSKHMAVVESAPSAQNKGEGDKISSISEHHSDTDELSGINTPPSASLDSSSGSPLDYKQPKIFNQMNKNVIYKSTGLHKF